MGKFITIKRAAEILNVCTATIRKWDKKGKIKGYRHAMNNYRMYDEDYIISLKGKLIKYDY